MISYVASRLSIWGRKKVYLCVGFVFQNFSFRRGVKLESLGHRVQIPGFDFGSILYTGLNCYLDLSASKNGVNIAFLLSFSIMQTARNNFLLQNLKPRSKVTLKLNPNLKYIQISVPIHFYILSNKISWHAEIVCGIFSLEVNWFILEIWNGTYQLLQIPFISLAKVFIFRVGYISHVWGIHVNNDWLWDKGLLQKDVVFILIKTIFIFIFML